MLDASTASDLPRGLVRPAQDEAIERQLPGTMEENDREQASPQYVVLDASDADIRVRGRSDDVEHEQYECRQSPAESEHEEHRDDKFSSGTHVGGQFWGQNRHGILVLEQGDGGFPTLNLDQP